MPDSFFPLADDTFRTWLASFVANEAAVAALALPLGFFTPLNTANTAWNTAYTSHVTAQDAAIAARATKETAKRTAIDALRLVVAQLRGNPAFTDTMAGAMGLPLYDTILTDILPPTEAPELEMSVAGPQEVKVEFWSPDASAPGRRGKAPGARSCRLVSSILPVGEGAPAVTSMLFLADDTRTPNNPHFDAADIGKTLWVRGAWVSPSGDLGPYSEPSSITIPG